MFRVIQLFVFIFGRIVHRTIRIRPNSLKPLFGTSLVSRILFNLAAGSHFLEVTCRGFRRKSQNFSRRNPKSQNAEQTELGSCQVNRWLSCCECWCRWWRLEWVGCCVCGPRHQSVPMVVDWWSRQNSDDCNTCNCWQVASNGTGGTCVLSSNRRGSLKQMIDGFNPSWQLIQRS